MGTRESSNWLRELVIGWVGSGVGRWMSGAIVGWGVAVGEAYDDDKKVRKHGCRFRRHGRMEQWVGVMLWGLGCCRGDEGIQRRRPGASSKRPRASSTTPRFSTGSDPGPRARVGNKSGAKKSGHCATN